MQIQIINPITYQGWDELLLNHEDSSFFHTSQWAGVLHEAYGYKPYYFSILDNGNLKAVIPLMEVKSFLTGQRGVSLPFTDFCEPLISEDVFFNDIIECVIDWGRKASWKYIEIRGGNGYFKNVQPSSEYFGHTLDLLKGEKEIFCTFRDGTKRNIKKSVRVGVEVVLDNSLEALKDFYSLNCMTRKMHGLPPQPYSFFEKIYDHVLAKNHGIIVTALYKTIPVASAVYFHFNKKAVYKYGASDREYQQLRANNLVMWEAIKYYSDNGYESLCFGRTDIDHDGLRRFKAGWGTKEKVIKYYKYTLNKETFVHASSQVSGFYNKVFHNMPVSMLKVIGSVLYKHMG